jgi:hypothetical protein
MSFCLQDRFSNVDIRVRVNGGGHVAQIYAIRQAISKALVAYYQKCKYHPYCLHKSRIATCLVIGWTVPSFIWVYTYSIPPLFRYTLRPTVLLPLLLTGRTLGHPFTTLSMSCLQSRFASSSVVEGSERVISNCAEEHGSRGVYLNKGGIEYSTYSI